MAQAALHSDPLRERLAAALRANDPYTYLTLAEPILASDCDDAEILRGAVRACLALGLHTRARELAARGHAPTNVPGVARTTGRAPTASADGHPPPGQPGRGLRGVADGRVAWSALRERYEANRAAFDARSGLGDALDRVWRANVGRLTLYACADGNYQVYSRLPDAPGWLPQLAPHDRAIDVAALRRQWHKQIIRPIAVCGIGTGHVALGLLEASRGTFMDFSPPVYLVERSLLAWAVVMHLHDWRQALAESRVHVCPGADALARLGTLLEDLHVPVPVALDGGAPWPGGTSRAETLPVLEAAAEKRARAQSAAARRVAAKVSQRDRARRAARFAEAARGDASLCVLGVTSRFTTVLQYTLRDLLAAFERLGHRTRLLIEPDASSYFSRLALLQAMEDSDPDLVINVDHLQAEYGDLYPVQVPGVCWIQDHLPNLFHPGAGAAVRPLEFVIGHGFPQTVCELGYPAERFLPCLIPTDPARLLDSRETQADLEPFRCDVMYATNASSPPERLHDEYRARVPEAARPVVDAAYELLMQAVRCADFCGDYDYEGLLTRAEAQTGLRVTDAALRHDLVGRFLYGTADVYLREQAIRAAADWAEQTGRRFHLYGRGWEQRPEFARFARGFVPHGPALGRAFRAAAIALHAGCNSALHQRVLDGLCAGGFFLVQDKPCDTMHELSEAVARYFAETRPALPHRLRPENLPAPFDEQFRRALRVRGMDPAAGRWFGEPQVAAMDYARRTGRQPMAASYWPDLPRVVFAGAAALPGRLEYFIQRGDERRERSARMRDVVLEHFTYDGLARQLVAFIATRLTAPSD